MSDPWVLLPPSEVMARAVIGPAPRMPLAELQHAVSPVRDATGLVTDWVLDASLVDDSGTVGRYRAWRDAWRPEWPLGPITNIAALAAEMADVEHDLDRRLERILDRLAATAQSVAVPGAAMEQLVRELDTVRLALMADDRSGRGIVDDMPSSTRSDGLARTWAPPANDVVLAGTGTSAVIVRPGGALALLERDTDRSRLTTVCAVDLRGPDVVVLDERGSSVRMALDACRPLAWLVPRSLRWHVREVPLVAVWALLLHGLPEALRTAQRAGGWVEVVPVS